MPSCRWSAWATLLGLLVVRPPARADDPRPPRRGGSIGFVVQAGGHDRRNSLVRFELPADRLDPAVILAGHRGPVAVTVVGPDGARSIMQVGSDPTGAAVGTWFLPEPIPAGGSARYEIVGGLAPEAAKPFSVIHPTPGSVEIGVRGRTVFRYNVDPVDPPKSLNQADARLARGAYIHPAFSPAGATVTGDFSAFHPHHRGLFLAYVHTRWGDWTPDFWNIQSGSGRIVNDRLEQSEGGPVSARIAAQHRWEALGTTPATRDEVRVALREEWRVELYDVPGSPYWLVDLTSTQQAETHPLELLPYRYGGMAYRSGEPSVKGPIDVLTAEGRHRFDGDQKPTRWVDLTGPVAEGSPNYAGVMIADHPANPGHPTVARIHPITLPFYSFVPAHARPLVIATDRPTVFHYRIVIHDGRPDAALNDRIAADFAEPVAVHLD